MDGRCCGGPPQTPNTGWMLLGFTFADQRRDWLVGSRGCDANRISCVYHQIQSILSKLYCHNYYTDHFHLNFSPYFFIIKIYFYLFTVTLTVILIIKLSLKLYNYSFDQPIWKCDTLSNVYYPGAECWVVLQCWAHPCMWKSPGAECWVVLQCWAYPCMWKSLTLTVELLSRLFRHRHDGGKKTSIPNL